MFIAHHSYYAAFLAVNKKEGKERKIATQSYFLMVSLNDLFTNIQIVARKILPFGKILDQKAR